MKKQKNIKETKDVVLMCRVKTVSRKFNLIPFNVFTISEDDKDLFEKRAYGSFDIFGYWIQNIKDRRIKIFKDEFFELDKTIAKKIMDDDFKYMYSTIINFIQSHTDDDAFLKFIHRLRINNFDFMNFLHALEAEYFNISDRIEEEIKE